MKKTVPPMQATSNELKGLIKSEHDGGKRQRMQAPYMSQSYWVNTRHQMTAPGASQYDGAGAYGG